MSVTISTRDIREIRNVYRKECGFVLGLENGIEEWIKRDMGVGV